MEHLIQFTVNIDDDKITEGVRAAAENKLIKELELKILQGILRDRYGWHSASELVRINHSGEIDIDSRAELKEFAEIIFKQTIESHTDELLDRAAEKLAESYKKTKAWKEKAGAALKQADQP